MPHDVAPKRLAAWQPPTPEMTPRVWPAWKAATDRLMTGIPVSRTDLIDLMCAASDIVPKTAANTIRAAHRAGAIFAERGVGGSLWYCTSPSSARALSQEELDAQVDAAMAADGAV